MKTFSLVANSEEKALLGVVVKSLGGISEIDMSPYGDTAFFPDDPSFSRSFSGTADGEGRTGSMQESFSQGSLSGSIVFRTEEAFDDFVSFTSEMSSGFLDRTNGRSEKRMSIVCNESGRYAYCRLSRMSAVQRFGTTIVCTVGFLLESLWQDLIVKAFEGTGDESGNTIFDGGSFELFDDSPCAECHIGLLATGTIYGFTIAPHEGTGIKAESMNDEGQIGLAIGTLCGHYFAVYASKDTFLDPVNTSDACQSLLPFLNVDDEYGIVAKVVPSKSTTVDLALLIRGNGTMAKAKIYAIRTHLLPW